MRRDGGREGERRGGKEGKAEKVGKGGRDGLGGRKRMKRDFADRLSILTHTHTHLKFHFISDFSTFAGGPTPALTVNGFFHFQIR